MVHIFVQNGLYILKTKIALLFRLIFPAIFSLYFLSIPNLLSFYFPEETEHLSQFSLNDEENKILELFDVTSKNLKHFDSYDYSCYLLWSHSLDPTELHFVHKIHEMVHLELVSPPPKIL